MANPDLDAQRPVYTGLDWTPRHRGPRKESSDPDLWIAKSATTPITYIVERLDSARWIARAGFGESPGRPNTAIGLHPDATMAMAAAERHDFAYWSSTLPDPARAIFSGSSDHVADLIDALADHERDDVLDMLAGDYRLPNGDTFAARASYFPARKAALKQERNGDYSLTLAAAPADLPLWMLQIRPGSAIAVGIAETDTSQSDTDGWTDRAAAALKRSIMLAADNAFQAWIARKHDRWGLVAAAMTRDSDAVEEAVAETLRRLIGCPSRRELSRNRDAIQRLEKLDREFYLDMSRALDIPDTA